MVVGELVSPQTSHQDLKIFSHGSLVPRTGSGPRPTHHPPSDRPLLHKTKVVVVTGIKKNSEFGHRPTLR